VAKSNRGTHWYNAYWHQRTLKSFVTKDVAQMSDWQLKIEDVKTPVEQLWLVARYTLG
jgi:hypothetical protein